MNWLEPNEKNKNSAEKKRYKEPSNVLELKKYIDMKR